MARRGDGFGILLARRSIPRREWNPTRPAPVLLYETGAAADAAVAGAAGHVQAPTVAAATDGLAAHERAPAIRRPCR